MRSQWPSRTLWHNNNWKNASWLIFISSFFHVGSVTPNCKFKFKAVNQRKVKDSIKSLTRRSFVDWIISNELSKEDWVERGFMAKALWLCRIESIREGQWRDANPATGQWHLFYLLCFSSVTDFPICLPALVYLLLATFITSWRYFRQTWSLLSSWILCR